MRIKNNRQFEPSLGWVSGGVVSTSVLGITYYCLLGLRHCHVCGASSAGRSSPGPYAGALVLQVMCCFLDA